MKEIKFRAWSSGRKEMTEVESIHFKGNAVYLISKYLRLVANLDETELMQFTGLQDCNGVDIYEGDIIELWYEICSGEYREYSDKGMVCFENGLFKIKCIDEQQEYDFDFFHHVDDSTKEVIGNIYENPELLEVE